MLNSNIQFYIGEVIENDTVYTLNTSTTNTGEKSDENNETELFTIKVQIDMDYNGDESFQSHKLISAAKGWANSLGYKVNVKPNNQIATRAADYHCK